MTKHMLQSSNSRLSTSANIFIRIGKTYRRQGSQIEQFVLIFFPGQQLLVTVTWFWKNNFKYTVLELVLGTSTQVDMMYFHGRHVKSKITHCCIIHVMKLAVGLLSRIRQKKPLQTLQLKSVSTSNNHLHLETQLSSVYKLAESFDCKAFIKQYTGFEVRHNVMLKHGQVFKRRGEKSLNCILHWDSGLLTVA